MGALRNIFACLVHERLDCVVDMVRNLRALDADSTILLYDGGKTQDLLSHFPFERYGAVVHPSPRPLDWGRLHPFALDCLSWGLENHPFDSLTIVDSDQLAMRPGYSQALAVHLGRAGRAGMLGNSAVVQRPGTRISPAESALREIELWRPFLRRFPHGEEKFVHWCFWPSTIFLADAARELTSLFRKDELLRTIMAQSRIWATEEIILPTLVSLLEFDIGVSPFSYDYVQYQAAFRPQQVAWALDRHDVYWMHPVPRRYDDPIRKKIRDRWSDYAMAPGVDAAREPEHPRLLLTLPILEQMRRVEGWLEDVEADLLIAGVQQAIAALPDAPAIVEVGSHCGRSTTVLGAALRALPRPEGARVYAIDPHDGVLGALDQGIVRLPPTLEKFRRNIAAAGLTDIVEAVVKPYAQVEWRRSVCLLLIDGLHDYASVARDFNTFERWIPAGGFVAFHDYAHYFPGVKIFVDELLAGGGYKKVHLAGSLMLLCKRDAIAPLAAAPAQEPAQELLSAPALIPGEPLVSCIMATADRPAFVAQAIRYFERQDYPRRELVIIDDGANPIGHLAPKHDRIRNVRLSARRTMGAKHNLACAEARGDIILHWDDDDWMAPWRISYQVAQIRSEPLETLSGLSRLLFWEPRARQAWEYVYPAADRPWVAGGTFCYRRGFWEKRCFPDMNEGADTVFVWGLQNARVQPLPNHDFYVGLIHSGNTSRKRTNTFGWRGLAPAAVEKILANDMIFYESLSR